MKCNKLHPQSSLLLVNTYHHLDMKCKYSDTGCRGTNITTSGPNCTNPV